VRGNLLSVEIVVESLNRAVEFLVDYLGCELVERVNSADPAGERALIDAGQIYISLLQPSSHGPGPVTTNQTPRLSQLVFGADRLALDSLRSRSGLGGLSITALPNYGLLVGAQTVAGALGVETAIVVTELPDS
jgi:catechol 2,3-dioxygenase-like lactoylglutathione lyase family enzyme